MTTLAETYQFSSEPKPISGQSRSKYRPDQSNSNIMYDRRIVRGNTYASQIITQNAQTEVAMQQKRSQERRRRKSRTATPRSNTPPPVEGRAHTEIQTDPYLEELTDRPPEADAETQTEAFIDRPPSPLFIPSKHGIDASTQVEEGELFDFDLEVEPILEVLVGKTLQQSMMEVLEEEELAAIRDHREKFEQVRNSELAEVQRMEAEQIRLFEEKQRRITQEKARIEREKKLREKVAAKTFSREYLSGLHSSVFSRLTTSGHFFDPLEREVREDFMPWLHDLSGKFTEKVQISQECIEVIIHASCTRANQIWQVEMAKREEERKQEEERKREERKIQEEERKKKLEEKEGKEEVDD